MFSEFQIGLATTSVLTLAIGYLAWIVVTALLSWRRRVALVKEIPCRDPHWLLGSLYEFPGPNERGLAFVRDRTAESPRMGLVWYGPFHFSVVVVHPETARILLKSSEPKPTTLGAYRFIKPWLGDGLLVSRDKKWARNRRLLTPAFHFDVLKPYIGINNEAMDTFLNKMDVLEDQGISFDIHEQVSLASLDILLRCAFSYDNDVQLRGSNHPFVMAIFELTTALTNRLLSPWLYNDFIYFNLTPTGRRFKRNCNYVHEVSSEIIRHRRGALEDNIQEQSDRRCLDFLDILLAAKDSDGRGLSDQEIRDEADTFLFEGHDTTASGIAWTLYALAKHPEHLKRCQEEVDMVLADRQSDHIQWEDLPKLSYVTMCIKEALRLYTPVPFIQREITEDIVIDGNTVPKGAVVDVFLYAVHHNPQIWEDSTEYRPSRFTTDNITKMDPFAFVPFSAGPRNCIGQSFAMHELKVVVARIVKRFSLELDPERPVKQSISVVMKTEDGLFLRVKARHD